MRFSTQQLCHSTDIESMSAVLLSLSLRSSSSMASHQSSFTTKLYRLYRWICFIDDSDDFTTVLRKVSLVIMLVSSPITMTYLVYFLYLGFSVRNPQPLPDGTPHEPLGAQINGISNIAFVITLATPYFIARWKRQVNQVMFDIISVLMLLCWTFTTITIPDYDIKLISVSIALFSILSSTRYSAAYALISCIHCLISAWNEAFTSDGGKTMPVLLVPGARIFSPPLEILLGHISAIAVVGFIVTGVVLQMKEHQRHLQAANAAIEISQEIVDLLRRYDTEGVSTALHKAASNEDLKVDPKLLESFRAMNENLEKYKPHLPNYMFMSDDDTTKGGEGGSQVAALDNDDDNDEGSIELQSDTHSIRAESTADTGSTTGNDTSRHLAVGAGTRYRRGSRVSSAGSELSAFAAITGALNATGTSSSPFKGKICFSIVDLRSHMEHNGSAGNVHNGLLVALVNNIYSIAQATKASIHTVVGDTAVLSWNATHRVPQPEVKAIKFLHQVRHEAQELISDGIKLSAACFSGLATSTSHVTSTKQQALLVQADWMPALDATLRRAKELNTVLINESLSVAASHCYETLAVDAVERPPVHSHKQLDVAPPHHISSHRRELVVLCREPRLHSSVASWIPLHEIVSEIAHAEDEWMYQLHKQERSAGSAVQLNQALDAALQGKFGEAREQLRSVEELMSEKKLMFPISLAPLASACDQVLAERSS